MLRARPQAPCPSQSGARPTRSATAVAPPGPPALSAAAQLRTEGRRGPSELLQQKLRRVFVCYFCLVRSFVCVRQRDVYVSNVLKGVVCYANRLVEPAVCAEAAGKEIGS